MSQNNLSIMMDLEGCGECLCQIGAVVFNKLTGEIVEEFCVNIDPEDVKKYGFKIDYSFWDKQDLDVYNSVFTSQFKAKDALEEFWAFADKWKKLKIWSHSLYDFSMIQNHLGRIIKKRLPYRRSRDITTLVGLAGISIKKYDKTLKNHNALSDCKYQIIYCVDALNKLKGNK